MKELVLVRVVRLLTELLTTLLLRALVQQLQLVEFVLELLIFVL